MSGTFLNVYIEVYLLCWRLLFQLIEVWCEMSVPVDNRLPMHGKQDENDYLSKWLFYSSVYLLAVIILMTYSVSWTLYAKWRINAEIRIKEHNGSRIPVPVGMDFSLLLLQDEWWEGHCRNWSTDCTWFSDLCVHRRTLMLEQSATNFPSFLFREN
jgi:hypothetical protein